MKTKTNDITEAGIIAMFKALTEAEYHTRVLQRRLQACDKHLSALEAEVHAIGVDELDGHFKAIREGLDIVWRER